MVNEFNLDIQDCCGHFSILADEFSFCSNKEQLPLVIRYSDRENNIQERFLKFINCDQGVTGKALTDRILDCLVNEFNLDIQNCCGQCHDGQCQVFWNPSIESFGCKYTKLLDICGTRWVMRIDGLARFFEMYEAIVETMLTIS